ncbi:hypothetical protein NMG60_11019680 [Bertholletia excelsa]
MACLNVFGNEQQGNYSSTPRISFSSDVVDAHHLIKHESSYRDPPVSSDFEFSVPSFGMISADEVIFKGKLLPLKEHCSKMTLREELLVDDEYEIVSPRLPKISGSWKERLGLKRAQIVPKKADKGEELLANKTGEVLYMHV